MNDFTAIASNPLKWVKEWKQSYGKKVIGCMPMNIPEEIIAASDMLPVALPGIDGRIVMANTYLTTHVCHAVRCNFESQLNKDYDVLDGVVFADLCDQARRTSNIWEIYSHPAFTFHMRLPKRLDTRVATEFYQDELKRFRSAVEKFSGKKIDDSKIKASIKLYNEVRKLLSDLYKMRLENPDSFAASELDSIVTSAMVMLKEDFKNSLSSYLAGKKMVPESRTKKPRLFVVGNPCEDMEPGLLNMIADVGGMIIDDYVYSGSMYLSGQVSDTGDPIAALAQAYIDSSPCPTKHDVKRYWGDYLVKRAKQDNADGVLLILPKYCELYAFDYPDVKQKLTAAGIPHLMLEVGHTGADAQLKTRLEAFIEMLR